MHRAVSGAARVAAALFVLLVTARAGDEEALVFSERASAKISEILEIKRAAMRLPGMRSENGKLGLDVERALHELSGILSPEERKAAEAHVDSDIRAKVAVWAVDREKRKEDYDRFAKYYVNKPAYEDAVEYFWRPEKKRLEADDRDSIISLADPESLVPRPGTWKPNPVDEDDRVEDFRLILEYCFYIPPTGARFGDDWFRFNMVNAMLDLESSDKSLVVVASDVEIILSEGMNSNDPVPTEYSPMLSLKSPGNEHPSLFFLANLANERAFRIVARLWLKAAAPHRIHPVFSEVLQAPAAGERHQKTRKLFDAWQALARKHEDDPEAGEFARWLLSLKPPADLQAPSED